MAAAEAPADPAMTDPALAADIRLHAARSVLYGFASAALRRPSEAHLEALAEPGTREVVRHAAAEVGFPAPVEPVLREVRSRTAQELAATYDTIFQVPVDGDDPPVVAYEAHYRDGAEEPQDPPLFLADLAEEIGPEDAHGWPRPDHVAAELGYMETLLEGLCRSLEEGDAGTAGAIQDIGVRLRHHHLADFAPEVGRQLTEVAADAYYEDVGRFLDALIAGDHEARRSSAPFEAEESPWRSG